MTKEGFHPTWANWSDEQLLETRMKDLNIQIQGTLVEKCISTLGDELGARGIHFRPHCYLGDEWFSPDEVPAICIPFYLAHPRLMKLEMTMMLEVEGGEGPSPHKDAMRFLRHECGHALVHAYLLLRRRDWVRTFGSPKMEFKDYYRYQPYSRNYVRHLENWYAQSHPEEDFCETFAVWLDPDSDWETRYRGWPVIRKLEYVERLMQGLAGKEQKVTEIETPANVRTSRKKLTTHYTQRLKLYAEDDPGLFDLDLGTLFLPRDKVSHSNKASRYLRREGKKLLKVVSRWTRERRYIIQSLVRRLATRCDELDLHVPDNEEMVRVELASYLSALATHHLFTGRFKTKV